MRTITLPVLLSLTCLLYTNCSSTPPLQKARTLFARGKHGAALKLYEDLCKKGEATACSLAGAAYEKGIGVPRDPFRAFSLTRRACGRKVMDACVRLARMSESGVGTARDIPRAFLLYQRACLAENFEGCNGLGSLYERGTGTAKDSQKAAIYYRRACAGKNRTGCIALATLTCFRTPHRALCAESYPQIDMYCTKGSVKACHLKALGLFSGMYTPPQGISRFHAIAKLSRNGCNKGYAPSCFLAAEVGPQLKKSPMNQREASRLISKACRLGYQRACVVKAHAMYDKGGKSQQEALSLYDTACKTDSAEACNALGLHFTITVKNKGEAAQGAAYFGRACFMEESSASLEGCLNLGRLFHRGIGVSVNRKKAALLYKRVCTAGIKAGCLQLKILNEEKSDEKK